MWVYNVYIIYKTVKLFLLIIFFTHRYCSFGVIMPFSSKYKLWKLCVKTEKWYEAKKCIIVYPFFFDNYELPIWFCPFHSESPCI